MATILLLEHRRPGKALAWLCVLLVFPIVGFIMYYLMAKQYRQRTRFTEQEQERQMGYRQAHSPIGTAWDIEKYREIGDQPRLLAFLGHFPESPIVSGNRTRVLTNANVAYKAMLDSIEQATDHIHMEFYTIQSDETGYLFQQALIRKAKQGLNVRLLVDGIGSIGLKREFIQDLQRAGVETACFLRPLFALIDKRINYRNHRKIVVIDGKIGFFGGINIGNEYLGMNEKLGFWRDTHFQIEGGAVGQLQHCFMNDWSLVTEKIRSEQRYFPVRSSSGDEKIQLIVGGPGERRKSILELYFSAIMAARKRIYITTPYFVPEDSIQMALKVAAHSGVDIRIIYPAVPDSKLVHWASKSYLEDLMQAGVRFFEYNQGFIHTKCMLMDNTIAISGSANLDMRSFYSNFEINAVWYDRSVIDRLEQDFMGDLANSMEIDPIEFAQRSTLERGKQMLGRLLSPLV
jgi:cardiolipin synthase